MVSSEITVKKLRQRALEDQSLEICERKGLGHPDSICDAIMNQVSIELSEEYLNRFGAILHHNLDKGLLAAGETEVRFKGGEVLKPMLIVFGDRATFEVAGQTIPVPDIAAETAKRWIRNNLRFVDPEKNIKSRSSQVRLLSKTSLIGKGGTWALMILQLLWDMLLRRRWRT